MPKQKLLQALILTPVLGCGGIIFLVAMAIIFSGPKTSTQKAADRKVEAFTMAKQFVTDTLKAPSTASFPWYSESFVTETAKDEFVVRAYVDAQNSFGAKLRSKFTVKLRFKGNNTWHPDAVNVE